MLEETIDFNKVHNNNNLVSAMEQIRSIKDKYNDKITVEDIDGQT